MDQMLEQGAYLGEHERVVLLEALDEAEEVERDHVRELGGGKEKRLDVGVGEGGYSEGHRVIDTTDNNQTKLDIYTQRERTQRERTQREKTQRERTQREDTK